MSDRQIKDVLDRVINQRMAGDQAFSGNTTISESAYYDFVEHQFLMEPQFDDNVDVPLSGGFLAALEQASRDGLSDTYLVPEVQGGYEGTLNVKPGEAYRSSAGITDERVARIVAGGALMESVLKQLSVLIGNIPPWDSAEGRKLLDAIREALEDYFRSLDWHVKTDPLTRLQSDLINTEATDDIVRKILRQYIGPHAGTFYVEYFRPGSINFGLQPVYRQIWKPLGVQTGEIVRTLPLGPRQTERISIKVVNRLTKSSSSETSVSSESTSESVSSTTDSSEIINELAKSRQYSLSVEARYGLPTGGFGASASASTSGTSAENSKTAKSNINESTVQSASKLTRNSKVVVSTESERTDELNVTSEITNPNDEIAVTYVYNKLQRQYEISTYLAELNTVVYVAERVPAQTELTRAWFQKHAAVLNKALIDPAYQDDLQLIAFQAESKNQWPSLFITGMSTKAASNVKDFADTTGTPPDPFLPTAQALTQEIQRSREVERLVAREVAAVDRLRSHISDNILHYCRAIWAAEDPDHRALRFRNVKVPTKWKRKWLDASYESPVEVTPDWRDPVPLSELVDPTGPIGFSGNYAVYRLRQRLEWVELLDFLDELRLPYLKVAHQVDLDSSAHESASLSVAPSPNLTNDSRYKLTYNNNQIRVERVGGAGVTHIATRPFSASGASITIDNHFRLEMRMPAGRVLDNGDVISVIFSVLPVLEDPELKMLRWRERELNEGEEASFYTAHVLRKFISYMPDLAKYVGPDDTWEMLSDDARAALRTSYHEYLLHELHTRRLLIDTNNLVLTRVVDDSSSIEPFKAAHRFIDAKMAAAKLSREELEVQRLQKRIDTNVLSDPDIEKVVIKTSGGVDTDTDM